MARHSLLAIFFAAAVISGCHCAGCNHTGQPDGSVDGGDGGNKDGGGPPPGPNNHYPDGGIIPPQTTDDFPPAGGFTFDGGQGGTGERVTTNPDGGIVLNPNSSVIRFAWIANSGNGWVSKYDTGIILPDGGLNEVARYYSVVPADGVTGAPVNVRYNNVNSPSRTAIDLFGDVWVANRAPDDGVQGSVTKIANDPIECVDRNGNGVIDTSSDVNGNGVIDMAVPGEFITPSNAADAKTYDECVLFTTAVSTTTGGVKARGLAVSQGTTAGSAGDIWVVLWNLNQVVKLNALNGQVTAIKPGVMAQDIGFGGYGAIVDRQQRLWVLQSPSAHRLALINTATGDLVDNNIQPPGTFKNQSGTDYTEGADSYGIGIDGKNRVWIGGWQAKGRAFRYDPASSTWTVFDFRGTLCDKTHSAGTTALGRGRGIAADRFGKIWMGADQVGDSGAAAAQVIGFDGDTGAIVPIGSHNCIDAIGGPNSSATTIGVALDQDDNIWANNFGGNVMKVNRTTGAVNESINQTGNLYSYSDFTGYELRNFTSPFGRYIQLLQGCAPETEWRTLTWSATTPPNTRIDVFLRVGNTPAELNTTATVYGPFTQAGATSSSTPVVPTFPIDLTATDPVTKLPVVEGRYMRLEFQLRTEDLASTPVLNSFEVGRDCEVLIP